MSKAFCLMAAGALLTIAAGTTCAWADQPTLPPSAPAVVAPANAPPPGANPLPPGFNALPPAANACPGGNCPLRTAEAAPIGRVSLRDKLFHGPLFSHPKGLCHGPCTSDDPDMGCGTCHSEWVFLFGSCCAFYNEPFYYSPWRR